MCILLKRFLVFTLFSAAAFIQSKTFFHGDILYVVSKSLECCFKLGLGFTFQTFLYYHSVEIWLILWDIVNL